MASKRIRVVSIVEGTWVTGPIKPLLMFAQLAAQADADFPEITLSLVTTARLDDGVETPHNELIETAREIGVGIDVIVERRAWDVRVVEKLAEIIKRLQPDIVETHQVKCHFLLAQALFWNRLKRDFVWIAFHHGYTKANLKLTLYESLDRWSLKRPDHVVTFCQPFALELERRGVHRQKLSVIANSVAERAAPTQGEVAAIRDRLGLAADHLVVLCVGRLSQEKGHKYLIDALLRVSAQSVAKVHLVVVGDGPERQMLHDRAATIGSQVHFVGHQKDVWPYYFLATVFALPSLTEGSPLVLFEAMAAQCAIVATRVGGVPETITDGDSGLIVPPGDAIALAGALSLTLNDSSLRKRLADGAARASERFTPRQYRKRLVELYQKLLPADAWKA